MPSYMSEEIVEEFNSNADEFVKNLRSKKDQKVFNQKLIDKLYEDESRSGMTATPDSVWVIYRHYRDSHYEFHIDKNLETLYRFELVKTGNTKERLIAFLKSIEMWEENK